MGYSLTIGEFECEVVPEERYASVGAAGEEADGAPLNSGDDHSNSVSPSYTGWHEFCTAVGLIGPFYSPKCHCKVCEGVPYFEKCGKPDWWEPEGEGSGRDGLLTRHPGAAELLPAHALAFRQAKERYLATAEPRRGLREWQKCQDQQPPPWGRDPDAEPVDYILRRLDWLVFWADWALANCKHPTFGNT